MIRRYTFAIALSALTTIGLRQEISSAEAQSTTASPVGLRGTGETRTELSDGRWLGTGGRTADGPLASAAMFDPSTGLTVTLPRLHEARVWHTATIL